MNVTAQHGGRMSASTEWQLASGAAERYEDILVPSILGPAARVLVDRLAIQPGERVLDVGCGTGAAARYAAERSGAAGGVACVDVNAAMLDVARRALSHTTAPIDLRAGNAANLPYDAGSFDVVLCAQTIQFLQDRRAAISEMARVATPGGRAGFSVWSAIDRSPYFAALVAAMETHIGADTAVGLGAAFGLSDEARLRDLMRESGVARAEIEEVQVAVELPALADFVPRHIGATPMAAGYAGASAYARRAVIDEVSRRLAAFRAGPGVRVPFGTYLVTWVK